MTERISTQIVLRLPTLEEEPEFLHAHLATSSEVPNFLHAYEEGMAFAKYLELLADHARGEQLPPNYVPSTFLFAFAGTRIVGRVSIRHSLNEWLEQVGGHIGYVVVPEFRRRGYATMMLRQSIQIAHGLGITRILVTCDDDNIGSIRTIEKNGGVLHDIIVVPHLAKPKRRYWIEPR
jgi:predicted acetyltransferase